MITKVLLKKQILKTRNGLNPETVNNLSERIFENIFNLEIIKSAKNIFIYESFKNEVNTKNAIKQFLKSKNVYLPKINSDDSMDAVKIDENTSYINNKFGIKEPKYGEIARKDLIDVCIVPGIVFDKFGGRAGYGKAYYDIFLRGTSIYKIAVCYDFQLIEYIPVDLLDVDMDCIVTENKTIKQQR